MNTFNDSVLHIDEAHNLKQSLKRKATKVRFALTGKDEPSKRNNVLNTVLDEMQWRQPSDMFCPVNDCLVGVVNLDWGGSKTLSVSMLYLILQTIENVNTANVKAMTVCLIVTPDGMFRPVALSCLIWKRYFKKMKKVLTRLRE